VKALVEAGNRANEAQGTSQGKTGVGKVSFLPNGKKVNYDGADGQATTSFFFLVPANVLERGSLDDSCLHCNWWRDFAG